MTALETVRRMYAAFAAKDRDEILRLFDPRIVWVQNAGFPGGGAHVGAEAVFEVFAGFRRNWEGWTAEVAEWLEAGDTVVAIGEYAGTYKATFRPMRAAFAGVYDVRDGRIVRFRQFTDTAKIAEAVGLMRAQP